MALLDILLAALPIVAIIAMLASRVRPIPAALIAIGIALALSFRFPLTPAHVAEVARSLGGVSIAVVLIMFGGIVLSEFLTVSGAQDRISDWLGHAAGHRDRAILLLGLGVAPLAESVIGWGVGLIVAVPLLMRVGLDATRACTIGLLGLILAPWGSLGPGILVMEGMSGLPLRDIGTWSAFLNLPVQIVMGLAIGIVGLGLRRMLRLIGEILAVTVVMWGVLIACNMWVSVPLAGILTSLAGIVAFVAIGRLRGGTTPAMDAPTRRALLPYGVLIGSMLAVTALMTLIDLGAWAPVIGSPALWLLVTAATAPAVLGMPRATIVAGVRAGARVWWPVCLVTLLFIAFGALLAANGMTGTLAAGAAGLGLGFLLLVPLLGFLGGYVTNSNTATAAMLAEGVTSASVALGANPAVAMGAQNVATGSAVMTSPARVALGVGIADGLRTADSPPADPVRIITTVLVANAVVVAVLAPLTLVLSFA